MPRTRWTYPEREEAAYERLYIRLQLDNINWDSPHHWRERCNLDELIATVARIMKYNRNVSIDGHIITSWTYWNMIKSLYYSPELSAAYVEHGPKASTEEIWRFNGHSKPSTVNSELLQAVYDIARKQRRQHHKRVNKFADDNLIPAEWD